MEYIKQLAFEDKVVERKADSKISRSDVFIIRNHSERVPHRVTLNENKLESLYN
jgi:hypothetical protein